MRRHCMMNKGTTEVVLSAAKQWWLKVNTEQVRIHALDGATFPHILKVQYTADGKPTPKENGFEQAALFQLWVTLSG